MANIRKKESWDIIIEKTTDFQFNKGLTSFINPYSMLLLKNNSKVAAGIDHWYVDGILLVKLFHKFLGVNISRFSFDDTSVAPLVFKQAASSNQRVAIIGSTEQAIQKAVSTIENRYHLKIHYFRNGYIANNAEMDKIITEIKNNNIDVVICGMGTPKQEEFLIRLKEANWEGYGYTCGGYIHQTAGKDREYYPAFFDKTNMRWLYRILDEPKLATRYLFDYPKFIYFFRKHFRKND